MLFFLVASCLVLCLTGKEVIEEGYALLIDAGSTGSRAFVFHFTETWDVRVKVDARHMDVELETERTLLSRHVHSIPSMKIKKGISTFVHSLSGELATHILPIFINASQIIPTEHWKHTQVYMKGTAGMRLLPLEHQDRLWNEMMKINTDERNPFTVHRDQLGTIEGSDEAYYAVIASNYIAGTIDGRLLRTPSTNMVGALDMGGGSTQLIFYSGAAEAPAATAATELGEEAEASNVNKAPSTAPATEIPVPVSEQDFWSHSWLNYGVEVVRERIRSKLIDLHIAHNTILERGGDGRSGSASNDGNLVTSATDNRHDSPLHAHMSRMDIDIDMEIPADPRFDVTVESPLRTLARIANPCTHKGYVEKIEYANPNANTVANADASVSADTCENTSTCSSGVTTSYLLVGTGKPQECLHLLSDHLWPDGSCSHASTSTSAGKEQQSKDKESETHTYTQLPCYLDNIKHPPVQGSFYGMSVYYYAIDAVKTLLSLSSTSAPNSDYSSSTSYLQNWPQPTLSELKHAVLSFCEVPWPGKPLQRYSAWRNQHKYSGSAQLPHRCFETLYMTLVLEHAFGFTKNDRHFTFALDVKGHEVEWTLGFALTRATVNTMHVSVNEQTRLKVEN